MWIVQRDDHTTNNNAKDDAMLQARSVRAMQKKRDCRDNENGSPESHRRARRGGTDYSDASVEEVIFVIAFSDAARDTGMRQLEQILAELAWEDGQ